MYEHEKIDYVKFPAKDMDVSPRSSAEDFPEIHSWMLSNINLAVQKGG
ncbi:MAG: hypothetical protein VB957_08100 [Pseudomonadales bacterium]|jgi:hypothetical protein